MKKILGVMSKLLLVFLGIVLMAEMALRVLLPVPFMQRFVQDKLTQTVGKPVQISNISAHFFGLVLQDVVIEDGNDGQESLLSAKEVVLRWSLWRLLSGHIKIYSVSVKNLSVFLQRDASGVFNFKEIFSSDKKDSPTISALPFPLDLSIDSLYLQEATIRFLDDFSHQNILLSDLSLSVRDLNFNKAFPISLNTNIVYRKKEKITSPARLGLAMHLLFPQMKPEEMVMEINNWVIQYEDSLLSLQGQIKNIYNPWIDLSFSSEKISEKTLRFFLPSLPKFGIERLEGRFLGKADPVQKNLEISSFTVSALDSNLSLHGNVAKETDWQYSFSTEAQLNMHSVAGASDLLIPCELNGTLQAQAMLTPTTAQGEVSLQKIGGRFPKIGTVTDLNAQINILSGNQIEVPSFVGYLNEGIFQGELFLKREKNKMKINVKASSPRIALPSFPQGEREGKSWEEKLVDSAVFPPMDIVADIRVDSLDAPYISGEDIVFYADVQEVTSSLSQMHGEISLDTGTGIIKDLNRLTNANILTKTLFGSLAVVSKVFNSLNIFSILSGITDTLGFSASKEDSAHVVQTVLDENGNEIEILVPASTQKIDGEWAFEEFQTDVIFENGLADIQRGFFVSDLMSFSLQGEMNFKTQNLALQVNAAPGRHYEGGIMPVSLQIDGTFDNPQGSMNVASSFLSGVTQGIGNNFISRSIKKMVGWVGSLFKKEQEDSEN